MTNLKSAEVSIAKSQAELYEFLSDFNNFGKFMPEQIKDWQSGKDEFSFSFPGIGKLGMKLKEKSPNDLIKIEPNGKSPVDFNLNCHLKEKSAAETLFQITLDADLNPMLKMLAQGPLQNFIDKLANRLKEQMN